MGRLATIAKVWHERLVFRFVGLCVMVLVGTNLTPGVSPAAGQEVDGAVTEGEDVGGFVEGGALVPMSIVSLGHNVESALVVDLSANRLFEVHRVGEGLEVARDYYVAIGKRGSDKRFEGDEKTPVGVYTVQKHIPGSRLPPIYGAGALPIDYPSPWDSYMRRTGSGIWIHGTNKSDDELLPRSSRGCLTLRNDDFNRLLLDVRLGQTPVIVANAVDWQPSSVIVAVRKELLAEAEQWRLDWESLDTELYLSHYHRDFRSGSLDLAGWTAHKKRVNRSKTFVKVKLSDIGVYRYPGEEQLYVLRFHQSYRSNNFNGQSNKQQYWKRTEDGWRIILEHS